MELIKPYTGSELKPLLLGSEVLYEEKVRAAKMAKVMISPREVSDLIMLGIGGFTPITELMGYDDWLSVCKDMKTADGLFWPIPLTVSTDEDTAKSIQINEEIALVCSVTLTVIATMVVTEKYSIDKSFECQSIYKTEDESHPGVKMVMNQGEVNLAGPVKVLSQDEFPKEFPDIYQTPKQIREHFKEKGWSKVAAFQTRNPMHRAHEHLVKIVLESLDGVLIHSLLGEVKSGDFPAYVRVQAINALIEHYFVKKHVIHAGYPLAMRYAGPREALLHAIFRQNYGCSHLIVGRDHASVGNYYEPFEAHDIFSEVPENTLAIKPIKMDWMFWCQRCDGMASTKTCPHTDDVRVHLSGTRLRELLVNDQPVPEHFSRPEVLKILRAYYEGLR